MKQAKKLEIINHLNAGGYFENKYAQYVKRSDGTMLRYDLTTGTYKFYSDFNKFVRACFKFQNTGY